MNKDEMIEEMAKIIDKSDEKCENADCFECEYVNTDRCVYIFGAIELYEAGYRKIANDEIVVKKREYEKKEIDSFLRGRESAFYDIESMFNVPKKDIDYIKTIDKAKQETAREILKELNDEGYKIYKQQGNTFDAGNFNWLIAYTMRKYGIELEEEK